MCEFVQQNICSITQAKCPYIYLCHKTSTYRPLKSMPKDCKIKRKLAIPKGYRRVLFERRGWLYIEMDDTTIVAANPFNEVPRFVKVTKAKDGKWRLRK